jgi:hypothetical protein
LVQRRHGARLHFPSGAKQFMGKLHGFQRQIAYFYIPKAAGTEPAITQAVNVEPQVPTEVDPAFI